MAMRGEPCLLRGLSCGAGGIAKAESGIKQAAQILSLLRGKLSNERQAKLVEEIRRYEHDVLRDVTWRSPN